MISVIICTYNRFESLQNTLNSISEMYIPKGLTWELIVVDNNSTDKTMDVVHDFMGSSRSNIRCVLEKKQGLSHARNRGISEAKGEIIAFTDDDVFVEKYWLANIAEAFRKYDAACIGGRIFPIWEKPKPKWLTQNLYNYLALLDYGDTPFYLDHSNIWGANFAIKADMFKKHGIFEVNLGRIPGKLYAGEETNFFAKLLNAGEKLLYYPDSIVHHFIPKNRISKKYLRKWEFEQGELAAIRLKVYKHRNIWGIPYYTFRHLVQEFVEYIFSIATFSEHIFQSELRLINTIGFLLERLRYRKNNTDSVS